MSVVLALAVGACAGGASPTPVVTPAPTGAAPTGAAPTEPAGPTYQEICAAGEQEGNLRYWHNHSDIKKVYAKFNEKYPGIKVEELVLSPDDMAQRVLTEASSGRQISADILAGGFDIFLALVQEGLADEEFDYEAFGLDPKLIQQPGNMIRTHRIAFGLGYNTNQYGPADLPNTWEELIDEKWRGQVIVDPRGRPFDALSLAWGREEALDYVRRLKDVVQPLTLEGGTAGLLAVASGEAAITSSGRSAETLEQQAKGVPVAIKYLDYVTTNDSYRLTIATSKNLNAARCFNIWFSTEGGQELYDEVEFKSNETIPTEAPANAQLVLVSTPEEAAAVKELGREMGRIWTGL